MIGQKKLLMDTIKTQLRQNNTKISAESEMTLCHTSRRRKQQEKFQQHQKNLQFLSVLSLWGNFF